MGKGDPQGGRPRKEIDMEQLANMAGIQCTATECAGVLNVSEDTLDRRLKEETGEGFAEFYKKHSVGGKVSLRRAQFKAATEQLNPTMLIWLGKQMLGQKDISRLERTGPDGAPVAVEVNYNIVSATGPKDGTGSALTWSGAD
jgi:hypothetical protein